MFGEKTGHPLALQKFKLHPIRNNQECIIFQIQFLNMRNFGTNQRNYTTLLVSKKCLLFFTGNFQGHEKVYFGVGHWDKASKTQMVPIELGHLVTLYFGCIILAEDCFLHLYASIPRNKFLQLWWFTDLWWHYGCGPDTCDCWVSSSSHSQMFTQT